MKPNKKPIVHISINRDSLVGLLFLGLLFIAVQDAVSAPMDVGICFMMQI
jgi:hypothetical protein